MKSCMLRNFLSSNNFTRKNWICQALQTRLSWFHVFCQEIVNMLKSYRKVWSRRVSSHVESGTNALISLVGQITGAGQANANSAFHFLLQPPFRESFNLSRPKRGNLKYKSNQSIQCFMPMALLEPGPMDLQLTNQPKGKWIWLTKATGVWISRQVPSSPFVQCCWSARMQIGRRGEAQYAAPPAPPLPPPLVQNPTRPSLSSS